jgi:predicted MFS family arabinose efflux permease
MGLVGAAFGLGFVVGPVIGGELYPAVVHLPGGLLMPQGTAPFFFAALLSLINWLMAWRWLPESHRAGRTEGGRIGRDLFSTRRLTEALRRPTIGPLLAVFFLFVCAFSMMESTLILLGEARLSMSPVQAGRFLGYVGVMMVLIQGGMVGRLARRFGEPALLVFGSALSALGLLAIAPAASYAALGLAMVPLALGSGLGQPCLNALLSRMAHADEQGGLLGVNQSLGSLARVAGPFVGTACFERLGTASPYIVGGVIMAAASALAWLALRDSGTKLQLARNEAEFPQDKTRHP